MSIIQQLRLVCITLVGLLATSLVTAAELELPDRARPGQVRPEAKAPVVGDQMVDIPAVIDRPFDVAEGPFILVDEFRLLDGEDMPEFGISIAEIDATILTPFKQQQPEQGYSIGQLQEVADAVTNYYRQKGLILTTAVVPVQTVAQGIVDIQVLIGRLGRVMIESNEHYNIGVLQNPFDELVGKPITQQTIEAALLRLTDYPGLSIFGIFQPGQKIGEADIVLKVQEEKHYDVSYTINNHGLETTGRNRFVTTVDWNSPTTLADRLTLSYQQTYTPKNSNYWSVDYNILLGDSYRVGVGAFRNEFTVGGQFAASQISATTETQNIYAEKSIIRSRRENLSSRLTLSRKSSITRSSSTQTSHDRLTVLAFSLDYDSVDTFHPFLSLMRLFDPDLAEDFGGGLNFANLTYSRGFNDALGALGSNRTQRLGANGSIASRRSGATSDLASGQFDKLFGYYQRLQLMTKHQSLLFRTEFQWSNDLLLPLEQYSLGGANSVRGYPDAQGLFDRSYFVSLEYIFNAPFIADKPAFDNRTWGELLQFSIFYDFAIAQQNDPLNQPNDRNTSGSWVTYRSVGAGLRFSLPGELDTRLMYAKNLGKDPTDDGKHNRIWADLTYSF